MPWILDDRGVMVSYRPGYEIQILWWVSLGREIWHLDIQQALQDAEQLLQSLNVEIQESEAHLQRLSGFDEYHAEVENSDISDDRNIRERRSEADPHVHFSVGDMQEENQNPYSRFHPFV